THTYRSAGTYKIAYVEDHRNAGILNITNSKDVAYVSSITISIDASQGCNHYPVLSVVPLDRACSGVAFYHNPGAYDVDGDSLSYEMTIPSSSANAYADYEDPNNADFYTNYSTGNEAGTGTPTFSIDAYTGLITWDAPGMLGEYNIAFKVVEWRKNEATGIYSVLSTTVRDMQIVVEECDNTRPDLTIPNDTCVVAGSVLDATILGTDADLDPVKIEVYSETLELDADKYPATYSPAPAVYTSSDPAATLSYHWQTDCIHVRQQPYQVLFKITDNPSDGPRLVRYKTWNIKVIAPAPEWKNVTLDVVNHNAGLAWKPYTCANASKIQIWRKVGSTEYTPGYCETGLPRYLGYNLIAEVSASDTTYTDTNYTLGLAPGAAYCYRLVAYFNSPAAASSYTSVEQCVGPVQADAPVITHVTVEKTAEDGAIRVSWRSPFNINEAQFPKPYQYEIYRANGFIGDTSIQVVSGRIADTTFVDTGINTQQQVFNYRIVLYAKPALESSYVPVDTSAVASSVWLAATPGAKQIALQWRDSIPWSNTVQQRPYHLIYRATGIATEKDLMLYDSINVIDNGFNYTDVNVEDDEIYSYKILTRGTYGNPAIALQENFSEMITAFPVNDLLPCAPVASIKAIDCDAFTASRETCTQSEFSNSITWHPTLTSGCRKDIVAYRIYATSSLSIDYQLLATITDTSFVETGLASYARCYRISAVDSQGAEGPLSDPVCNDNCPYYALPNVFTPNADGCNDVFTAQYDGDATGSCQRTSTIGCPRFVKSVRFRVYNRWGREVYAYLSDAENSININWNGKDTDGNDLSTGVYYYTADVEFDVIYPAARNKKLKSWVHVLR
ncbi:MAG TPA: gliding motility-associated C-terminal domain-containing protein, partial [Ohtaekwangia sp.]|uniref:T9SS type B sorting domain-containing protein n=1 Tax=Ohtaekwangia sp. TaxID=2066019 RepID=UPI002F95E666